MTATVDQPVSSNGSGTRSHAGLPTAPKRPRNTIWIVGGIALMLVSLVGALTMAQTLSARQEVLIASRPLSLGETVVAGDLEVAEVAIDGSVTALAPSRQDELVGMAVAGPIAEGAVLTETNFAVSDDVEVITVIAGLELDPGAYPRRGLTPGDQVSILEVSDLGFGDDVSADPGKIGDGEVVETQRLSTGDTILVSVRIPERIAEQLSQAAFEKRVRLVQKEFTDSDGVVVPLNPVDPAEAIDPDIGASESDGAESDNGATPVQDEEP